MMRWGEFDDLYHIAEIDEPVGNSDYELDSKDGNTASIFKGHNKAIIKLKPVS